MMKEPDEELKSLIVMKRRQRVIWHRVVEKSQTVSDLNYSEQARYFAVKIVRTLERKIGKITKITLGYIVEEGNLSLVDIRDVYVKSGLVKKLLIPDEQKKDIVSTDKVL